MISFPTVETADVFEWLALVEALSFEDLDFIALSSEPMDKVLLGGQRSVQEFKAIDGGKRLFVMPEACEPLAASMRANDIACIHTTHPLVPAASLIDAGCVFSQLAHRGLRVCLLYRCGPRDAHRCSEAIETSQWAEWTTPHAERPSCSGLMFSKHWRKGVSAHAARVIGNYMNTLAPQHQVSVAFH